MGRSTPRLACGLAIALAPALAAGEPIAGVCPDGSAFVVQSREDIPCPRARTADPSELPPLRPRMLPRPYTWYVDQEERDPQNPYNLLEAAQRMRAAREGVSEEADSSASAPSGRPSRREATQRGGTSPRSESRAREAAEAAPALALADDELRDLVKLVALRQQLAPAELLVSDVRGRDQLRLELARSESFERRLSETTGRDGAVIVFAAIAEAPVEFQPNFFVVQGAATHRPDPSDAGEVGYLVGEPGEIPAGSLALGYFALPAHFDPQRPLTIYWNDRSIDDVVLSPAR